MPQDVSRSLYDRALSVIPGGVNSSVRAINPFLLTRPRRRRLRRRHRRHQIHRRRERLRHVADGSGHARGVERFTAEGFVSDIEAPVHTGEPGDATIFVLPVEGATRIRTGKTGPEAV